MLQAKFLKSWHVTAPFIRLLRSIKPSEQDPNPNFCRKSDPEIISKCFPPRVVYSKNYNNLTVPDFYSPWSKNCSDRCITSLLNNNSNFYQLPLHHHYAGTLYYMPETGIISNNLGNGNNCLHDDSYRELGTQLGNCRLWNIHLITYCLASSSYICWGF